MSSSGTALVTGAAAGIGQAIAQRLAEDGFDLVLLDVNSHTLSNTADMLARRNCRIDQHCVDLGDIAAVQAFTETMSRAGPLISVLVNNAALSPKRSGRRVTLDELDLDSEWLRVVQVNLTAPLMLSRMAAPMMKQAGWGRIINISSLAARCPSGLASLAYTATKTGLVGLTRALAQELARDAITVNSVAPGRFATAMGENLAQADRDRIISAIPVGRWGEPAEVAGLISYLCKKEAGFVTGAVLDINGGAVMV